MVEAPDPRMADMLGRVVFVVLTRADTTMAALAPYMTAHLDHQIALEKAGTLLAASPWINEGGAVTGGLVMLRAGSLEEVDELMADDPFVSSGMFTYETRRWRLNEGRMTISVDFSDGQYRFE